VLIGFFLTFTSLAISIFLSTLKITPRHYLGHYLAVVIVGLGLFVLLPINDNTDLGVYAILMVGCFIASLMLFLPFYKNDQNLDFVNYLKHLVVNFIVSIVFSLIVFAGLAGFYAILKTLFGINIPAFVYAATISLIFTTIGFWIFVYLLPFELRRIGFYDIADRTLHILAAYVLLPFSIIYAITIYIYSLKIIFTNVWPQNQVAVFIGLLFVAWFVVYFLIQSAESKVFEKLKYYWRLNFIVSSPLLIVYFMAIGMRIKQYGFTEDRCLSLFLGIICLLAGLYLAINRFVRFKYIPIIIGFLLLLMSFGPWGISNISKHSQINRYAEFLVVNQFIVDGQINMTKKISRSEESYRELKQMTFYLLNFYGVESITKFFPNLDLTSSSSQTVDKILDIYLN